MKDRKPQNTALLIATLGVYLGLVLAGGATPQILAQAATAKQFDLKDETGRRDDLDKKPDDPRSPVTDSVKIYLEDVENFLATLGQLQTRGGFDVTKDTFDVAQSSLLPCTAGNRAGRYTPVRFAATNESSGFALNSLTSGMVYGYSLGDCIATNEFTDVTAADSRFSFNLDASFFAINVSVKKNSPQRAADLQRQLADVLALYARTATTPLRKSIIDSTSFSSQNDQVFIVLRLPRGSLPSLLASAR